MNNGLARGGAAGLIGGAVFGSFMEVFPRALPSTGLSMILFAAQTVHAQSRLAGWLAYLVYGLAIGALFGWLLHARTLEEGRAIVWGGLYGLGWWIVASLVLVPALRGAVPFSPSAVDAMHPVALALLAGHVLYGLVLGAGFPLITGRFGRVA